MCLESDVAWSSRTGGDILDSFRATAASVIDSFTEKLCGPFEKFQWMNTWLGDSDTRGNLVYANLHYQPMDFDKTAFIALGSLRAYPNQQFRKLQWAILDDLFPLSNACVETIVRQSLYQVGDLADEEEPQLLWKTDMHQDEKGLQTFCSTLKNISETLEQTPRRFECVPLLSELTAYAYQYTPDAKLIVELFAGMATRWVESLKEQCEVESSIEKIAECRQKECILNGYALLAYTLGEWDDIAAQNVCKLIVLFLTAFLCASINVKATDYMLRVESRVAEMMSRRITELVTKVETIGINSVLTDLIRLVSPTCPSDLKWKQVGDRDGKTIGSCFENADANYAINLFTGVVLTDGNAPGGLPTGIREHERFLTLFGRCNFEVVSEAGVLRMQRQYCDRVYDFALQADEELFVQELTVDKEGEVTNTLQLCSADWIQTFGTMFPVWLRELYSHWYWEEKSCVLFRPMEAKNRNVFVARFDASEALQCYKVPFCDWERSYDEILNNLDEYDSFVQKEALMDVLQVLTKFEDGEFLQPLKSKEGVISIELPRFHLTFCLNSNHKFESVEHKGYILAMNRQFDEFLPRFTRYLVLELQDKSDTARPELRMLLPVGSVKETGEGMVDITIPSEANSFIDVACYDMHRRLKTFGAETVSARLQLAAICIRVGTSVPCKRLRMTGAEAAVQMLPACWPSRPYSSFEVETLQSICKLSFREPAVKILAVSLMGDANRLAFLFDQVETMNLSMDGADEKTEYSDMCVAHTQRNPLRCQLMRSEENRILGNLQRSSTRISCDETIKLESADEEDHVKITEAKLQRFLSSGTEETNVSFPLELNIRANPMIQEIMEELRICWDCYHSQPQIKLKGDRYVGLFLFDVT